MYTFEQWNNDIIDILYDISSKEWQYNEWIVKGEDEFVISADELICMFYDDSMFEDSFIKHEKFNTEEKEILNNFNNIFNIWLDKYPKSLEERIMYFDPEWDNVREEAKIIIKLLENRN